MGISEFEKILKETAFIDQSIDVLIVDDVRANVFLVEGILSDTYNTDSASCGNEMWEKLKSYTPKIIILDLMMPDENGFQILEKMAKIEEYKKIPVIVASAKNAKSDILKALALGAKDYVVKPIGDELLLGKIDKILKGSK